MTRGLLTKLAPCGTSRKQAARDLNGFAPKDACHTFREAKVSSLRVFLIANDLRRVLQSRQSGVGVQPFFRTDQVLQSDGRPLRGWVECLDLSGLPLHQVGVDDDDDDGVDDPLLALCKQWRATPLMTFQTSKSTISSTEADLY